MFTNKIYIRTIKWTIWIGKVLNGIRNIDKEIIRGIKGKIWRNESRIRKNKNRIRKNEIRIGIIKRERIRKIALKYIKLDKRE